MKSVLRGAFTALMITLAFAFSLSAQTLLRLAPPEGQVSRYVFSMELHMENPMMPMPGPALTVSAHQTLTVLNTAGEVIRVGAVVDSSSMTVAMPGAGPAPDLAGEAFTLEMDRRGPPVSAVSDGGEGSDATQIAREMLEGAEFFRLPEAEVDVEDSWTEAVSVPLAMGGPVPSGPGGPEDMEVEFTYTLTSLEDGHATITFTGAVESTLTMGGMPANVSGELSGSMIVDLAEGRYVLQESTTSLEMAAAGMAIPMETTTRLQLVTDP